MGHFFNYNPNSMNQETASELTPEIEKKKDRPLTAPEEWTACDIEKELTDFSRRNKE